MPANVTLGTGHVPDIVVIGCSRPLRAKRGAELFLARRKGRTVTYRVSSGSPLIPLVLHDFLDNNRVNTGKTFEVGVNLIPVESTEIVKENV